MSSSAVAAHTSERTHERWICDSAETGRQMLLHPLGYAGSGTYSEVWQVRDAASGRIYALKQLLPDWADQPVARRLLDNEAEIGRKVRSDYVVRCLEDRSTAADRFLLLEWLEGDSLARLLNQAGPLPCGQALWIARQVAQGMLDLLQAGYIHGDIKPANIFVCTAGGVKLIDLGFAQPAAPSPRPGLASGPAPIAGTPSYMAPEALVPSHPQGVERDIYSLGITLYQMLTGEVPFQGETASAVLQQQLTAAPPRLRQRAPNVPRALDDLLATLLAKHPLRRGPGLASLVQRLLGLELQTFTERV